MQSVVFPESNELVINDFADEGSDDLVVVDIATGESAQLANDRARYHLQRV